MSHLTDEDTQKGESPRPVPFKASKQTSFDTSVTLPPLSADENREDSSELGKPTGSGKSRRNATRVTVAQPEDVEWTPTNPSAVRPSHIIKIFLAHDGIAEVTPKQVQRVRMMHERMEESVNFSFNFNVLLLVASILAGLGLVSNSSATIIPLCWSLQSWALLLDWPKARLSKIGCLFDDPYETKRSVLPFVS